jgi:mRNA-degrading endonuclease RelE of RelBE toxin-antitoxin system
MAEVIFLPPAIKFFKKLKDKKLKSLYENAIKKISEDPNIGVMKHGDLEGIFGYDIYYNRINYELAYRLEERVSAESGKTEIVIIIMAGTRENFYDELKRYIK